MKSVPLGELMATRVPTVDPSAFPDEQFTLWSIPSFDAGKPVSERGRNIGSSKKLVMENDVLLSKIVPHIRRSWVVRETGRDRNIASSEWIVFRHPDFEPKFIRHFLISDRFHAQFMATVAGVGGSLLRAQPKGVAQIRIPFFCRNEQQRFVQLLDRAAEIRRRADAARAKARAIIPALFLDMFGDPTSNPQGWKTAPLLDVADIGSGLTKGRKLTGQLTKPTPYLRVANVQDGYLDLAEIKTIDATDADIAKCRLEPGDLLMTEGGDPDKLGRCAIWRDAVPGCVHQNHIFRVRIGHRLNPEFAAAFIQSDAGKGYFLRIAKRTTGIATINKTQLGALQMLVPPLALQTAFAEQVTRIESVARALDAAAAKAEAMAAALSAEVFG